MMSGLAPPSISSSSLETLQVRCSSELSVGGRVLVDVVGGGVVLGGERTCPSAVVESLVLGLCACW